MRIHPTFFSSDNGNRFGGFGGSDVVLGNQTEVVSCGRIKIVNSGHCLLTWNQDAIDICLPVPCWLMKSLSCDFDFEFSLLY